MASPIVRAVVVFAAVDVVAVGAALLAAYLYRSSRLGLVVSAAGAIVAVVFALRAYRLASDGGVRRGGGR